MIIISLYNRVHDEIVDYVNDDYLIHDMYGNEYHRLDNYPGYYIDIYGNVLSMINNTNKVKILAPWTNQHGHQYVGLRDRNGIKKKVLVHRLVAETFIPNMKNDPIVRHMNDDPDDNSIWNLSWGTLKDNTEDCRRNGHMYVKPVYCYENNTTYPSCAEAAEAFGVTRGLITMCCQGKVHAVKSCHFCYSEDKDEKMNHLNRWINKNGNLKPIIAKNLKTGKELYFSSRREAANTLGMNESGISNVIAGRIEHVKGWTFYEPEEDYEDCKM